MRLKCNFEIVEMGSDFIAVPVGNGANKVRGVLKLNKEGLKIFNLLREDTTVNNIIEALSEQYDNDREILTYYVQNALSNLSNADLLVE